MKGRFLPSLPSMPKLPSLPNAAATTILTCLAIFGSAVNGDVGSKQ